MTGNPKTLEAWYLPAEEDETGFVGILPDYPGVLSYGKTLEELKTNLRKALLAMLESYAFFPDHSFTKQKREGYAAEFEKSLGRETKTEMQIAMC